MIIKVCGMRDVENIRAVEQLFTVHSSLFTSWMGFIFWPKSSRYVAERPAYLPTKCKRVGVFVDAAPEEVKQKAEDYDIDFVQLHGNESPDFICQLRSLCGSSIGIIKAFNISSASDLEATKPYEGIVDYYLFDAKGKSVGGNGTQFDWTVLTSYAGETPFLLSGGIGLDDAERIKDFLHEKCIGIDLNSRFEIEPALKDVTAIRRFLRALSINKLRNQL